MAIELTDEQRAAAISHIKTYFSDELGDDIGNLAAELLLRDFIDHIGPLIYNSGIRDARQWFGERMENLDIDYSMLLADEAPRSGNG